MTVHLLHGFNVADGGRQSIGALKPHLDDAGLACVMHDYGWTGPLRLRWRNRRTVDDLLNMVRPGDVVAAHSNGALIAWQLVRAGAPLAAVVVIQPALRRDTWWPPGLPVLCVYNRADWIVELGRVWSRLVTRITPGRPHGWGAAGRHGFTRGQPHVRNLRTDSPALKPVVRGHSAIFDPDDEAAAFWRARIVRWVRRREEGL